MDPATSIARFAMRCWESRRASSSFATKRGSVSPEVCVGQVPERWGAIGLRVPGALAYRHLAIRLVSTACKMALEGDPDNGDDDQFEAEVTSAFGEALNNIALHAYGNGVRGQVQVEVEWNERELGVTLVDSGQTFDPKTVASPNLDALPENGLGLFIIGQCVDVVDYRPGPPNVLRLVKRRPYRCANTGADRSQASARARVGIDATKAVDADVRVRQEAEAARQS